MEEEMNETSSIESKLESRLPSSADESSPATTFSWVSWFPIPVFMLAVIFLSVLDIRTVFEPRLLMPIINALVFVCASGVAAYLARRGFLAGGAPSLLLLGSGMLTFGLACLVGSIQTSLGDVNAAVTTHNIGALIAGAFHLVSAIGMPLFGAGPMRKELRRPLSLGLYTSSFALLGIVAVVAWYGILPDFITPSGTTFLRSTVLTVTVMEYLISALLFGALYFRERRSFLYWYSLGLGLIGIGLAGVGLEPAVGSPVGWAGRISQSIGQIYTLICLVTVVKGLHSTKSSFGWRIGISFRQIELEHRAILEASVEGIWILDAEGVAVYANRRAAEMLACSADELIGNPILDLISSNDDQEKEKLSRWLTQPGQREIEITYRRKDGSELWIQLNASPIKDAHGRAWGTLVLASDITERKRAEEALRASDERFNLAVQAAQEGIWDWNMETNAVFYSPQYKRMLGYTEDEIEPHVSAWSRLLHPDDRARAHEVVNAVMRGEREYEMEFRLQHKDGHYVDVLSRGFPVRQEPGGPIVRIVGTHVDLTERKQAEEQLRTTLESIDDGFFAVDGEWRFVYVNAPAERILGIKREEVLGKSHWEVFPLTLGTELERRYRLAASGQAQNWENFYEPWGRWFHNRCSPRAGGGMSVSFQDITERKQVEQELERMRNLLAEGQRIAHVGSFEYVAATRTTVWSEEEYRIYGLDPAGPSPAYDVMLAKYIHPDDAALLHQTFSDAMQSNSVYELEHRIVRPDGSVRWVYDRALPYFDDSGKLLRYVGATLDITERKQAEEELRAANQELEEFNRAMVGREFRMIELKKEINAVCAQLGQPPRYPMDDEEEQP
jgi:PAS domain S-box-containing protein